MNDENDVVRVLDADGRVADGATVPDLSDEQLVGMYRDMVTARRFDERAVSLQRQGRMGTYAPLAGQEGAQIGSTYALRADDWISFQYREHGAVVVRGLLPEYLRYWMGHESGNAALADEHIFPLNISIAGHLPQVVGMGFAFDYRGDDRVVVAHFGDGATSEGDFHEALNFAGVWNTPTVFFCNNNQWAISVPREEQTASETLAQKARAYGFDGVRVDGMDPLASYQVTKEAVERARDPDAETRPTLVEAILYRYGAHTTADDPDVYRDEAEVQSWRERDPVDRLEAFLRRTDRLDDDLDERIRTEADDRIAEVIEAGEAYEADPTDMFADVYAEQTPELRRQAEEFARLRENLGDEAFERD